MINLLLDDISIGIYLPYEPFTKGEEKMICQAKRKFIALAYACFLVAMMACGNGALTGLTTGTTGTTSTTGTTTTTTSGTTTSGGTTTGGGTTSSAGTPVTSIPVPGGPTIFFSDLQSGPNTGWEGSSTKGSAVSIWGANFGSSRGTNYVTVNGVNLVNNTDYAEWGTSDTTVAGAAMGRQRTTFWINSGVPSGAGTISVTINGVTSNTVPFTVRPGNIYFISNSGSDSNNGKYSTSQSGGGPWASFYMSNAQRNTTLKPGDIVYVRAGTYGQSDPTGSSKMSYYRGYVASAGNPLAVVGYPGDTMPVLGTGNTSLNDVVYCYSYSGACGYIEFHKMSWQNPAMAADLSGYNIRVVGNVFANNTASAHTGVIFGLMWDSQLLGNVWRNSGYDNYKHMVYLSGTFYNTNATLNHSVQNVDIGYNELDTIIGNATYPSTMGGGAIDIKCQGSPYPTNNIRVFNNYMHDSPAVNFVWMNENADVGYNYFVYNNLIVNSSQMSTGVSAGTVNVSSAVTENRFYVYNNTFYNTGTSNNPGNAGPIAQINVWSNSGAAVSVQSKNNIFYSVNGAPYLSITQNSSVNSINSDHDLFFGNGAPTSATGVHVTNALNLDPLFVNLTNRDFHLQAASPAIDTGTSSVNTPVVLDYDNVARPHGAAYDIGAYEY